MALKSYIPSRVSVVVGSVTLEGLAEDSFVDAERKTDAFTSSVSNEGKVTRIKSSDRRGTIKVSLQGSSDSNDYLSSLAVTDDLTNVTTFPVIVKDNNGTDLATAPEAWITKIPSLKKGKDLGKVEWTFECAELIIFIGSND
jgi:hypothetical protein